MTMNVAKAFSIINQDKANSLSRRPGGKMPKGSSTHTRIPCVHWDGRASTPAGKHPCPRTRQQGSCPKAGEGRVAASVAQGSGHLLLAPHWAPVPMSTPTQATTPSRARGVHLDGALLSRSASVKAVP